MGGGRDGASGVGWGVGGGNQPRDAALHMQMRCKCGVESFLSSEWPIKSLRRPPRLGVDVALLSSFFFLLFLSDGVDKLASARRRREASESASALSFACHLHVSSASHPLSF